MEDEKKKGFAAMIVKDMPSPEKDAGAPVEEDVSDSEFAAKEFLDAIKSGDPKSVASAFKALSNCSGEEYAEPDTADADEPNPESE